MSCVGGNKCGNPLALRMQSHGVVLGFCATHLDDTQKLVKRSGASGKSTDADTLTSAPHVADYTKLAALLQCRELFYKVMKDFTDEASRAQKSSLGIWRTSKSKIDIPLSASLSAYDGLCWFNTQRKLMSGLLSAEEFQNAIRSGFMVKDPGPGPDHGEFSHRLQWHYIQRVVTDRFTVAKTADWNLTPLELYCGMGNEGFTRNIWGALLEGNGVMMKRPGSPDWVNEQFRAGGVLGTTSFGNTIEKRYDKRKQLVDFVAAELRKVGGFTVQMAATAPAKVDEVKVDAVVEHLYKWKKATRPAWISGPKPTTISRTEALAADMWNGGVGAKYASKPRTYQRAKNADGSISEGLLLHQSEDIVEHGGQTLASRLASSRGGLNPRFKYSKTLGAGLQS
jgi:hypothetical protein